MADLNRKNFRSINKVRKPVLFLVSVVSAATMLLLPLPSIAEESAGEVTVYKDPSCECCGRWVSHMRQNGFSVVVNNVDDMTPVKRFMGIPEALESCHTATVGNYRVEGHVPASDIKQVLAKKVAIKGLAVPGMPMSAPGMDSPENEPYTVLSFDDAGTVSNFSSH